MGTTQGRYLNIFGILIPEGTTEKYMKCKFYEKIYAELMIKKKDTAAQSYPGPTASKEIIESYLSTYHIEYGYRIEGKFFSLWQFDEYHVTDKSITLISDSCDIILKIFNGKLTGNYYTFSNELFFALIDYSDSNTENNIVLDEQ